ncbi:trypsin-like [Diachasmimorpha longicaudata]|uniref:trypsin-like n=1 Tax=Diachasmimorpha longicaudata TaxID=58733 RepID=UPI0030B87279
MVKIQTFSISHRIVQWNVVIAMNMFSLSIVLTSVLFAGVIARAPQKIVHGEDASISEFPSTVVIQRSSGRHLCGGTLISNKHVLTAAHCFTDGSKSNGDFVIAPASGIRIIPGQDHLSDSNKFKHYLADRIDVHPEWQGPEADSSSGDLAIVTLQTEIPENKSQKIASLPSARPKPGSVATAVGWGLTQEDESGSPADKLQRVTLKVLDYNFCKAHRDPLAPENVICAEGMKREVSTCAGDSGGPLYNADKQVIGVVSYSYSCSGTDANIFTDVFAYISWIEAIKH